MECFQVQVSHVILEREVHHNLSNSTDTTLTNWATVEKYQGGITYASGVFTVPSTGVYLIFYTISWDDNTTGTRNSNYYINNSGSSRRARINFGGAANAGQGMNVNASDICALTASDTLRVVVWQNCGASLGCIVDDACRIGVVRIF